MILRDCKDFYEENPMMVTSLIVLSLIYIYYRARVVHLPFLYCRSNSRLGWCWPDIADVDLTFLMVTWHFQSPPVSASRERGVLADVLVLGVQTSVPGLHRGPQPADQRHQVQQANVHLLWRRRGWAGLGQCRWSSWASAAHRPHPARWVYSVQCTGGHSTLLTCQVSRGPLSPSTSSPLSMSPSGKSRQGASCSTSEGEEASD